MRRNGFDPVPELGAIRDGTGVQSVVSALGNTVYLVTRHDDVKAVLADHEHFSNARPPGFTLPGAPEMSTEELARTRAGNLLGQDPPEHQRLRRLLTPEFTIRRMKRLEPRITEIVDEHLDALAAGGAPADLVAEFALPMPSLVICELLGVPYGRPGRLSAPLGPPARSVAADRGAHAAATAEPQLHAQPGAAGQEGSR